jgi:hypothetical protein
VAFEFRLPDIGEGIHEGEIVKWFLQEMGFLLQIYHFEPLLIRHPLQLYLRLKQTT